MTIYGMIKVTMTYECHVQRGFGNMKLLLFSDLHADRNKADAIVQQAQAVDILIGAGDFANVRRNLQYCIDILRAVDRPTILVAGNNETTDELRGACRQWPSAHILH